MISEAAVTSPLALTRISSILVTTSRQSPVRFFRHRLWKVPPLPQVAFEVAFEVARRTVRRTVRRTPKWTTNHPHRIDSCRKARPYLPRLPYSELSSGLRSGLSSSVHGILRSLPGVSEWRSVHSIESSRSVGSEKLEPFRVQVSVGLCWTRCV
jgi:hypothetical protein